MSLFSTSLNVAVATVLVVFVMLGALPLCTSAFQFLLVGFHARHNHYGRVAPYYPNVAVIVPAWNESLVISASLRRLLAMAYPPERLRVYVVDDASTDDTPQVVASWVKRAPDQVFGLRRRSGGQGKAHTLNFGLAHVLAEDWAEAVLIIDADVVFEPDALAKMTRHLADPKVGAVTAYIKEGSASRPSLTRFIAFEYITAQAAGRRAGNVLGTLACLAGGAQLHSRDNIEGLGARIDTSTLAEDTVTTFATQLAGRKVVFEPHAVVLAEEPSDVPGLWRQRLRWSRGNVQVTRKFARVWFRPSTGGGLGSLGFGAVWFSLLLLPVFMLLASTSLVVLFFSDFALSWQVFRALWISSALAFVFVTAFALMIDPATGRHTALQGVLFPGAVSLAVLCLSCFPALGRSGFYWFVSVTGWDRTSALHAGALFSYVWLSGCMVVSWLAKPAAGWHVGRFELGRWLSPLLLYVGGYGPLLCAVTFSGYVSEFRGKALAWDKTVKTGRVTT